MSILQLKSILRSIAESSSTQGVTWIFADKHSSSDIASQAAHEYSAAAASRASPFFCVTLNDKVERADGDPNVEDVDAFHHIGGGFELQIDITDMSASQVAQHILEFMGRDGAPYINEENAEIRHTEKCTNNVVEQPVEVGPHSFGDIAGFKHVFIKDAVSGRHERVVDLLCWLKSRPRNHGGLIFLDVVDSTGSVQVIVSGEAAGQPSVLQNLIAESSLEVSGTLSKRKSQVEIIATRVQVVQRATRRMNPSVRALDTSILASKNVDKLLSMRHIYLRNPILLILNELRSHTLYVVRCWFEKHRFNDFSAPLITPSLLYDPTSAIHLANLNKNRPLYLSQCAGFYLEAGAHAHERVYNLGPSFRNESRTNRHLMEYWHIKAELCSGKMDDIIILVELFLRDISHATVHHRARVQSMLGAEEHQLHYPFKRIRYSLAVQKLQENNVKIKFGDNISKLHEEWLTKDNGDAPLWITHKPKGLEPFPYSLDPDNDELTMTADLIAPYGFGEICGVAEKSFAMETLDRRLGEMGKLDQFDMYDWVRDMRNFGMVPHTAFGMGFERLLRWLCGTHHVRDVIPFPRIFGREPIP
jgi:Aspartyl/asparaginyl-tRNA synthetases